MRRYYCPDCGSVHTLRPQCYERRFAAPVCLIFLSLYSKLKNMPWLDCITRQRQQYWMRGFWHQVHSEGLDVDPISYVYRCYAEWLNPATHSLDYRKRIQIADTPYRCFAATTMEIPP